MSASEVSLGRLVRLWDSHPPCQGLQFDIRGHPGRTRQRMGTEGPWSLPADGSWNLRTLRPSNFTLVEDPFSPEIRRLEEVRFHGLGPVSARPWDSHLGSRSELWAERRLLDQNPPGAQEAAPVCGRPSDGGGPVGPDRGRSTKDPGTVRASLARRHPRPRFSDGPPTRLGAWDRRGPPGQSSARRGRYPRGQHPTALTSAGGVPSRLVER